MKFLEEENARPKKMFADLAMDNQILKDLFTKKAGHCHKKAISGRTVRDQGVPVSRAYKGALTFYNLN
jgi:putative transposase